MNRSSLRVRFAPSPTGHLHLGSLRTALFNWLYARHTGGAFLVRIEDTDRERSRDEYTQALLDSLAWAGISPDEPIMVQSERYALYQKKAKELLAAGKVYRCYCSPAELRDRLGENAATDEGYVRYDRRCRTRPVVEGVPYALRFAVPLDRETVVVDDQIRGLVSFPVSEIDDFIIVRSDGIPIYNFVVVVDDAAMGITDIIRAEEHLNNTPRQIMLYEACGYQIPRFAHLALILGPDGTKLSKRHGATAVIDYRRQGYLADALLVYLARLGWAYGDQEIFTRDELIRLFSLEGVNKKASVFDPAKLAWVNSVFIKQMAAAQLRERIVRDIDTEFIAAGGVDTVRIDAALELYKERVTTLCELRDSVVAVFHAPVLLGDHVEQFSARINLLCEQFSAFSGRFDRQSIESLVKNIVAQQGCSLKDVAMPLRYAWTGSFSSPSIFVVGEIIGQEEAVRRLNRLQTMIQEKSV
jgi:glutamyl-tRNA synthetase